MFLHKFYFIITVFYILLTFNCIAVEINNCEHKSLTLNNTNKSPNIQPDKRLEWWQNARFGIFIHWGVYSLLGGEYKGVDYGKEMGGASAEWIFKTAKIPKNEYREIAQKWNPRNYNPELWCKLAVQAGAKYIVLTAKHHDGLALFNTKSDDWDVINSTAYGKDIIQQFVNACRKYKLKVGIYYSQQIDWYRLGLNHKHRLTDQYKAVLKSHLKTIYHEYKPDLIWFDMGKAGKIADIAYKITKQIVPNCVICGRIGGGYGDYKCMKDRHLPPANNKKNAETPMTMRLNWGFDKNDKNWKSPDEIIKMLSICATRNTNLLLNIGPDGDGELSKNEINILKSIGSWMKINSDAIYNTHGTPFNGEFTWGSLTVSNNNKNFFIHIHNKPDNGQIIIPGVLTHISNVFLMTSKEDLECSYTQKNKNLTIQLPEISFDTVKIIKLSANKPLVFDSTKGPKPDQ